MSSKSIDSQVIRLGERHDLEGIQKLIATTSVKSLQDTLTAKLRYKECATFWNYLLLGFDAKNFESREKRFACVKCFLDNLLKVELSYKQTYDLITRLCQDLDTFPSEQLVDIYEHCIDGIRLGDPKCVGWKDLLPETVKTLSTLIEVNVNGISMTGAAYREIILRNLCTMRWPIEVLTPIANMFKDLNLNNEEIAIVLKKLCNTLDSLSPTELPALCFQIFSMCTTALQIIVLLLALEKYFHRYYYKKLFADMNSNSTDFDSIDKFSDKELREAEETILHHLNYCTQFKITELQMCSVLRNFQAIPDVVLTPFMLSAIISMTGANREPDSRLSTSILLPFLRSVIKNNEDERILTDQSLWCRDSLQRGEVDLVQLFAVLIDQNKDGKDVITPGLVNLAFLLLKTKNNPSLNILAITFLIKFVRKRFFFSQGVIKKLVEWMIVEQDQYQYSECLTQLSVADTFTVSECTNTLNYFMDFLLWIPGQQAMRMMSFILPILKISPFIRDAFIEILRKAMNSSDDKTRHMAIYGFCMILKQLNNSNSQRPQSGLSSSYCTQHSISGFSLMSQMTLGNRNNPQRHFDMLTLEIIGVLRNCFSQTVEIKTTLYENLQRAVELNSKLTPHILQFIDWHFRSYFEVSSLEEDNTDATEIEFSVKFDKTVQTKDLEQNEIVINDNIGQLILFVSHCLYIFEKYETDYDIREIKRLLKLAVQKVTLKELKWDEPTGSMTHYKHALISQQVNFIEGLIAHMVLDSKQTNENVTFLGELFREHQKLHEIVKKLSAKKTQKKSKNETDTSAVNVTINGVVASKMETEIENIWDLDVIEKLLRLLHENIVPFASSHNTTSLRSNVELVRYVLVETTKKIEAISLAPEYKQLSHSKRVLKYLTDITKVIYERCIKRLPELWLDFDMKTAELAAECFQQCLQAADKVYKKNFTTLFVKGFDIQAKSRPRELPETLHNIIDKYMKEVEDEQNAGQKIPVALLHSLEVLYDNILYVDSMTTESYSWLLKFCKEYTVRTRQLCVAHKLLFTQRQKTHSGAFFNLIALQFARVLGRIDDNVRDNDDDEEEEDSAAHLKSINLDSAGFCLQHFFTAIRKQIQDVEYFIVKANSSLYKHKIIPESDRDLSLAALRSLQRSICTQMVHISNALYELTNVCIPLGPSMDGVLKLLMQHYVCLKNLAKHFLSCVAHISLQGSKFELLLRVVGKPLPVRVYAMITYIESNILDNHDDPKATKKKINPKADKDKVLRETKQIPKLILCMENFNKHVIILSKKDNVRLADFLHYGIARDFRVRSEHLKAAISRTLSHSSQIETDASEQGDVDDEEETLLERMEAESMALEAHSVEDEENASSDEEDSSEDNDNDVDDDDDENNTPDENVDDNASSRSSIPVSRSRRSRAHRFVDDEAEEDIEEKTPTPDDLLQDIGSDRNERNSKSQLIRNLKKVNTKAKKRALEIEKNTEPDVASMPIEPPQTKRRRGRSGNK